MNFKGLFFFFFFTKGLYVYFSVYVISYYLLLHNFQKKKTLW
jgi:hypothetical protein